MPRATHHEPRGSFPDFLPTTKNPRLGDATDSLPRVRSHRLSEPRVKQASPSMQHPPSKRERISQN
jgi:hypothetical protein